MRHSAERRIEDRERSFKGKALARIETVILFIKFYGREDLSEKKF